MSDFPKGTFPDPEQLKIERMTTHFIYEEFYPNAENDAKFWADEFVGALLHQQRDQVELALSRDELTDQRGNPITLAALLQQIDNFFRRYPTIIDIEVKALACQLDGDYAAVELATTWTAVRSNPPDLLKTIGRSHLRLKRSSDEYWEVVQVKIAGWE